MCKKQRTKKRYGDFLISLFQSSQSHNGMDMVSKMSALQWGEAIEEEWRQSLQIFILFMFMH